MNFVMIECTFCMGKGTLICSSCNGMGVVTIAHHPISGIIRQSCTHCSGTGKKEEGCIVCDDRGEISPRYPRMPAEGKEYHVKPETGVTGRTFLSTSVNGDVVDLWNKDDDSGRQKWLFTNALFHDFYYIKVYKPGGTRKYLSCSGDGACVDLWHKDDGSGRQRWRLIPLANGSFYIKSVGAKGRTYLSSNGDGTVVDLWHEDTRSGAQRWILS